MLARLLFYVLAVLVCVPTLAKEPSFSYLQVKEAMIFSTHEIKFSLTKPLGYRLVGPTSYSAVFNKHPFDITFAALVKKTKY